VLNNVQRAVEFLLSKKFISKKKVDQRIFYQITNEEVSSFLDSLLKVLEPFEIQSRSHALNERALELLDTMEERSSMITHAKRKSGR
jgi:hypothetical protein